MLDFHFIYGRGYQLYSTHYPLKRKFLVFVVSSPTIISSVSSWSQNFDTSNWSNSLRNFSSYQSLNSNFFIATGLSFPIEMSFLTFYLQKVIEIKYHPIRSFHRKTDRSKVAEKRCLRISIC